MSPPPLSDPIAQLNAALEGRYRIEREVGEGGMANVYLAHDLRHERKVALKVLKPELAAVVGSERFLAEIKTTANLHHPHILPLFDSGTAAGYLYYVMPYMSGESLREKLDRETRLPEDEAVRIAADMAEALDYAHRQGVIHRDIKPSNVLMVESRPVIADFGIALAVDQAGAGRLTQTGISVGTTHYMSPEQALGDETVDEKTDHYALGCVLYEMLVGEPPYTGSNAQAILAKIITSEPVSAAATRESVRPHIDGAIRQALERLPADRFSTASAFAKALTDPEYRYGGSVLESPRIRRIARRVAIATAVLASAAMLSLGWSRWVGPTVASIDPSIAVMPFENLSGDAEQEFFVRGLSEEILVALAGIDGLKVSGRISAFALKDSDLDVQTIASRLGVANVLEGSVRRTGDRVRISAHLVEGATGFDLWSDTFEQEVTDIWAIQDSIARAIADRLRITLAMTEDPTSEGGEARFVASATESGEAHEAYLRALYFRGQGSLLSLGKAIEEYERAIALDAEYARAWAGLAEANLLLLIVWGGIDMSVAHERALVSAETAVGLDPDLASAHVMLGFTLTEMGQWSRAEAELRAAVEMEPGSAEAHKRLGNLLWISGRPEEGLRELGTALELDPVDIFTHLSRLWGLWSAGRIEEALEHSLTLVELAPDWPVSWDTRTGLLLHAGQFDEARAAYAIWARLMQATPDDALQVIEAMIRYQETDEPQNVPYPAGYPPGVARTVFFYAETGQSEITLRYLQGMVAAGAIADFGRVHLIFARGPRDTDPRYQALLDRAGITW